MSPGDLVTTRVKTHEEEYESDDQGASSEEVDPFPG